MESEEEMPSSLPVGWDKAQNALCSKRWDHLVSLYEQPLREQPGNVFIVSLHGSLNPVHWDHIRMFEAAKKIIEKKVEGSIVIGAVRIIRDEHELGAREPLVAELPQVVADLAEVRVLGRVYVRADQDDVISLVTVLAESHELLGGEGDNHRGSRDADLTADRERCPVGAGVDKDGAAPSFSHFRAGD